MAGFVTRLKVPIDVEDIYVPLRYLRDLSGGLAGFIQEQLDDQIALHVGQHEIEFTCKARDGHDGRDFSAIIMPDLKPHHEYLVDCDFDSQYESDGTYTGSFRVKEQKIK